MMATTRHKCWNSEKSGTWTTDFIKYIYILSQNILKYKLENKIDTNEETREAHLQNTFRPQIQQYMQIKIDSLHIMKTYFPPI